jgi:hypothetical protein
VRHAYRVSLIAGFYGVEYQNVALMRLNPRGHPSFWVAERRKRITQGTTGPTKEVQHQWVDGKACPQLAAALAEIDHIPQPSGLPPSVIRFHGASVKISRWDGHGFVSRQDYEGPVAEWWRATEIKLAPCWRSEAVRLDGQPLTASLSTDDDERRFGALHWGVE